MERPIFKPLGTCAEDLDTPVLVVDLDSLEHNLETVHSFFRDSQARLRPHMDAHRCPAIAHKQIAAGGAVEGVAVTTVGEAEVFAQSGFSDFFITSEIVAPPKIARLCALAHHARITVAADSAENVRDLSEAAASQGVTLNVVVDIHTRLERCGVEPGKPALELAQAISKAPGLRFAGLTTYEGAIITDDADELAAESRRCIQQVLDTREMIEKAGLEVQTVAAGGTHNYEIAGAMTGVTEVHAGSYALMDYHYRKSRPQLRTAARVIATVISRPQPDLAILDAGQKAVGMELGAPAVEDIAGANLFRMSAEHGFVALDLSADGAVDLGGKVWVTPLDIGTTANLYDYIHAIRGGRLEAVWDVSARGRYR